MVTKLVPKYVVQSNRIELEIELLSLNFSSGKLSQTNMVSIQLVHTMATQIFNSNVSTFITTKLPVKDLPFSACAVNRNVEKSRW